MMELSYKVENTVEYGNNTNNVTLTNLRSDH